MNRSSPSWAEGLSVETFLRGRFVVLEALDEPHADELWPIFPTSGVAQAGWWEYLHTSPPIDFDDFKERFLEPRINSNDGLFYAIIDSPSAAALGWVCLNNIHFVEKRADVGIFLPEVAMQKTARATDALYLLLHYTFEKLRFERVDWKTDALHMVSRRAAERLGFVLDRVMESEVVVNGTSRGVALYTLDLDKWNIVRFALARWLDESNFDEDGKQRRRLQDLMGEPG